MNKVAIIFAICFAVGCYADVAVNTTAWAKAPAVILNATNAAAPNDVNFTAALVRLIAIGKSNPIIYAFNQTEKVQDYIQRGFDAKSLTAKDDANFSVTLAQAARTDVTRDNENYIYVTVENDADAINQIWVNQVPLAKDGKEIFRNQITKNVKANTDTYIVAGAILTDDTVYVIYLVNNTFTYIAGNGIKANTVVAPANVTGLVIGNQTNVRVAFQMIRIPNTKTAYTIITLTNTTETTPVVTVYENIFDLAGGKFTVATNYDLTAAVVAAKASYTLTGLVPFAAVEKDLYGFYFADNGNFVVKTGPVGNSAWKAFTKAGDVLTVTQGPKNGLALFWTNNTVGNNTLAVQTVDTKLTFGPVNTLITGVDRVNVAGYSNGNKYVWINQGQVYWVGLALNANILKSAAIIVAAVIAGIFAF